MRFEEVSYHAADVTVSASFHATLTVVGPLGRRARSRWVDRMLGVLFGTRAGDGVTVVFADATGQRVCLFRDHHGGATLTGLDSGGEQIPAAAQLPLDGRFDWFASIGLDPDEVLRLVHLDASGFKRDEEFDAWQAEDDLVEARQELGRVEAEYQAAMAEVQRVADLYQRVDDLDAVIGDLEEERARRRHRQAVAAVRHKEGELAALRRAVSVETARREAVRGAARAGAEWRRASDALAVARMAFGTRPRLDPERLRSALALPNELPAGLEALEASYRSAQGHRTRLPTVSATFAPALAHRDQMDLWARAEWARAATDLVAELSSEPDGNPGLYQELEVAHRAVEAAEQAVERARVPAMAVSARRALARARRQEQSVLGRMGFSSWFAFQLERVDAMIRPDALEALRAAEADRRRAVAAWREAAGDVEVDAALAVRAEIERYAAAVRTLPPGESVEPAYQEARAALEAAYRPFGVMVAEDDPDLDLERAGDEVRSLVTRARDARLQRTLEEAEAASRAAGERFGQALAAVDPPAPGGPDDLTAALDWVSEVATETASPGLTTLTARMAALEVELEEARSALSAFAGAEPDGPVAEAPPLPDADALLEARAELFEEAYRSERTLPDVNRLDERRQSLSGQIAQLEELARIGYLVMSVEEAEMVLVDRVAAASRAGPLGEPIPLVIDDALAGFERRDRLDLLHLLARLGEATQLVYLTDDPATLEWAAAAAGTGDVALVQPRPDPLAPEPDRGVVQLGQRQGLRPQRGQPVT